MIDTRGAHQSRAFRPVQWDSLQSGTRIWLGSVVVAQRRLSGVCLKPQWHRRNALETWLPPRRAWIPACAGMTASVWGDANRLPCDFPLLKNGPRNPRHAREVRQPQENKREALSPRGRHLTPSRHPRRHSREGGNQTRCRIRSVTAATRRVNTGCPVCAATIMAPPKQT